jgi:hypothetical protein
VVNTATITNILRIFEVVLPSGGKFRIYLNVVVPSCGKYLNYSNFYFLGLVLPSFGKYLNYQQNLLLLGIGAAISGRVLELGGAAILRQIFELFLKIYFWVSCCHLAANI